MALEIEINSAAPLRGTWFAAQAPKAVAVLHGATGVPHRFYRHFAMWLAQTQHVSCLTYDYRDFGASCTGHVRHSTATMANWGIDDQQAARDWLSSHAGDAPIWVIGHSLGGLMLGHQTRLNEISRVITVCSGPVHTNDHPWPYQALVRALWFGVGPAAVKLWGYVPARVSGLGTDIPGPVFHQWKRWCTTAGFEQSDPTVAPPDASALSCPLRTIGVSDDASVPPHVAHRLARRYLGCPHEHVVLSPNAFGLSKVGHSSIFARRNAAMWPSLLGA